VLASHFRYDGGVIDILKVLIKNKGFHDAEYEYEKLRTA
jgi:hypothetical protein